VSGDEDGVGERDYAQRKHVPHIRNSDSVGNANISDVSIQPMWILEAICIQLFSHRIFV
jgi:desulfoferrodoxin (superoxide reductase-like protein)